MLKTHLALLLTIFAAVAALGQGPATNGPGRLLSVEGRVEVARSGMAAWTVGTTNQLLHNGDRVRTGVRSRALIQLSDRSLLRVNELTTLEVRPPQTAGAKAGFEMKSGAGYFFNRERPGSVEFRTPLASGAIRGTEFNLLVAENGRTELSLLDGLVELTNEFGGANLASGEQGLVEPGQPPRQTALLDARSIIQWVLYYPGILDVDEAGLSAPELSALKDSVAAYRAGDLLAALEKYPKDRPAGSDAERVYRAATLLAVGQVAQATQLIQNVSSPLAGALRSLVQTVKGYPSPLGSSITLASEWMAESYAQQARSKLEEALAAARNATVKAPQFGFAWERVAELEFSLGHPEAARQALDKSLALAPRNAQAHAVQGFLAAARGKFAPAEKSFAEAIALDPALANGWLGRGLVRIRRGEAEPGRQDLQVAAILEPGRSLLHSYLGKAWFHAGDTVRAEKELKLAQKLDPADPTPWLYAAVLAEQQNKVNEAVRDLERSQALNDNRSVFRSGLLLDQDKAMRSVNLARIYQNAGLSDWSVREASRAVSYDYANYSAHEFLANSYDALRDPKLANLRYEAPGNSEYFIANLLAPVGATRLSQSVSQQEYTRLFDRNHVGVASSTEYFSSGTWVQQLSQYGNIDRTDWSLDAFYLTDNGQRPNNDVERMAFTAKVRQQITVQDTVYFEAQINKTESGDVLQYYNQGSANPTTRVEELQKPNLFAGYHHEWSPGNHTLAMVGLLHSVFDSSYLGDALEINRRPDGAVISTRLRPFNTELHNSIEGYIAELQQILTFGKQTIVFGGRYQNADSDARDLMSVQSGSFPGSGVFPASVHVSDGTIERVSGYIYDMWQIVEQLHLTAGLTYDYLSYPQNQEAAPLSSGETDTSLLTPKVGLSYTPFRDTTLRGAYTRSLGGVFFDNSFRLEPTQVEGFNQAFRSLIPESVIGNLPGTKFETLGFGLDQKFGSGTYLTLLGEQLESDSRRTIGAYDRYLGQPVAVASSTPIRLKFQERTFAAALSQLIGDHYSVGVRYRFTDAQLRSQLPEIPSTLPASSQKQDATLQQLQMYAGLNLPCGFFSQFQAIWSQQDNQTPALAGDNFWQFNLFAGYRFWRHHAEAQIGLLNLTDQDYKLNPLTLYTELPRERTFYTSFKFYF